MVKFHSAHKISQLYPPHCQTTIHNNTLPMLLPVFPPPPPTRTGTYICYVCVSVSFVSNGMLGLVPQRALQNVADEGSAGKSCCGTLPRKSTLDGCSRVVCHGFVFLVINCGCSGWTERNTALQHPEEASTKQICESAIPMYPLSRIPQVLFHWLLVIIRVRWVSASCCCPMSIQTRAPPDCRKK